jgi:hypothetical protein
MINGNTPFFHDLFLVTIKNRITKIKEHSMQNNVFRKVRA